MGNIYSGILNIRSKLWPWNRYYVYLYKFVQKPSTEGLCLRLGYQRYWYKITKQNGNMLKFPLNLFYGNRIKGYEGIWFRPVWKEMHYENKPIQIHWKFYNQKNNFSDKNSDIFHISAENIDCGYSLEPPRRGGSNE